MATERQYSENTKLGAPTYYLGTVLPDGRQHIFTGLPAFRSGMEACDYARSRPRHEGEVWTVFEYRDVINIPRNLAWGLHVEILVTV